GIAVAGRTALDVGASTGGFTDCLLQRGARRVIAVDVGYGQLAWRLRQDARVFVLERTNVRALGPEMLPETPDLATIDVSFISLTLVLPRVAAVLAPGAAVLALVKPQFEVGRGQVGKGGVVRDPAARAAAVTRVREEMHRLLGLPAIVLEQIAHQVARYLARAEQPRPESHSAAPRSGRAAASQGSSRAPNRVSARVSLASVFS